MAACETDRLTSPADDEARDVAALRRKILVALDEGDESIYALSWALDNLIVSGSNDGNHSSDLLFLLHVQQQPSFLIGPAGPGFYTAGQLPEAFSTAGHVPEAFFTTPEVLESVRKYQEEISKKVFRRAKAICDKRQIYTETMVELEDPRYAICDAVEKLHADFLVIGSHGYGAIKRAFLGSVSDYCAHNAKCPVVIVKKP